MYRLRSDGSLKTQGEIRQAHPNTSYPKIWTVSTCNDLDIDPVLITPKPVASSDLKIVIRDGVVQDQLSNWVEAWTEVDRFRDIPEGLTKAEQETAFRASEFEKAKKAKIQAINDLFKAETATIKSGVMQEEIDTFNTQEREALAFQADTTATVPLLTGLATVRGLTVSELAVRVLGHADAYKGAISQVMGKKHAFEDQVKLAITIEDINAIEIITLQ